MKKILIVEDRQELQEQYMPEGKKGVEKLSTIPYVDNCIGQDCKNHLEKLRDGDFSVLHGYSLIIYHRSALGKLGLINEINHYCRENKKSLIHFTGAESVTQYSNIGFEYLLISRRLFYSNKLFDYIDSFQLSNELPLISFAYGKNWKLPYYLELRNKLWMDHLEESPIEQRYQELCDSIGRKKITYSELEKEIRKITLMI